MNYKGADIVIEIRGGIAELVECPPGLKVIQRDYDTEGADPADFDNYRDEAGETCYHREWTTE